MNARIKAIGIISTIFTTISFTFYTIVLTLFMEV